MKRPTLVRVNEFIPMRSARSQSKMIRAVIVILLTSSTLARSTEQLNRRVQLDHALQEAYHVGEGSGVHAVRTARSLEDRSQEYEFSSQEIFNDGAGLSDEKSEMQQRVPKCSLYFCSKNGICGGEGCGNAGSTRQANEESLLIHEQQLDTLVKILNAIEPRSDGKLSEPEERPMTQQSVNLGRFSGKGQSPPFTRSEVLAMFKKLHEMNQTAEQDMHKDRSHPQEIMHIKNEGPKEAPTTAHEELKSMIDKLHTAIFKKEGGEKSNDAEKHMLSELSKQLTTLMKSKELMDKLRTKRQAIESSGNEEDVSVTKQEEKVEETTLEQGPASGTMEPKDVPESSGLPRESGLVDRGAGNSQPDEFCKAEAIAHGHTRPVSMAVHQIACELKNLYKLLDMAVKDLRDEIVLFIHIKFAEETDILNSPIEIFIKLIEAVANEPERITTFIDILKESIPLTDISSIVDRIKDAGRTILRLVYNVINQLDGGRHASLLEKIYDRLLQILGGPNGEGDSDKMSLSDKIEMLKDMAQAIGAAKNCYTASGLPELIKSSHISKMVTKVQLIIEEHVAKRPALPSYPPEVPEIQPEEEVEQKIANTSMSVIETKDVERGPLYRNRKRPRVDKKTVDIVEKDYTPPFPGQRHPYLRKVSRTEQEKSSTPLDQTPSMPERPNVLYATNKKEYSSLLIDQVADVTTSPPLSSPEEPDLTPSKGQQLLSKVMSRLDSIITKTGTKKPLSTRVLEPKGLPTITAYYDGPTGPDDGPIISDDDPGVEEDDRPALTTTTHTVRTTEIRPDDVPEIEEPNVITRTSTDTVTSDDPYEDPIISERVRFRGRGLRKLAKLGKKVLKGAAATADLWDPIDTATINTDKLPVPPSTPEQYGPTAVSSLIETKKSATISTTNMATPESPETPEDNPIITNEYIPRRRPVNLTTDLKTVSAIETLNSDKTTIDDDPTTLPKIEETDTRTSTTSSATMHAVNPAEPPTAPDSESELPAETSIGAPTVRDRIRNKFSKIASTLSTVVPPPVPEVPIIVEDEELPLPPPISPFFPNLRSRIAHNLGQTPLATELTETKTLVKSKEIMPEHGPFTPNLPHLRRYKGYDVSIREREYPAYVHNYPHLPPAGFPPQATIEPPIEPLSLNVVPYDPPSPVPWPSALGRCIMSGRIRVPFTLARQKVAATIGNNLLNTGDVVIIRLNDMLSVYGIVYDETNTITFNILRPEDSTYLLQNFRTIWNLIAEDFPDSGCDTLVSNAQLVAEN